MSASYSKVFLIVALAIMACSGRALADSIPGVGEDIPDHLARQYRKAIAEEWVYLFSSDREDYWLLPQTIKTAPNGRVAYWYMALQGIEADGDWASARGAQLKSRREMGLSLDGFATYSHSMFRDVCDCEAEQSRNLAGLYYNKDGKVITSFTLSPETTKWVDSVPGSNGALMIERICNPTKRKTFRQIYPLPQLPSP